MMIKVGLTGNMGTGKTIVARIFMTLGVPVYHADEHAKRFLECDEVVRKLTKYFGSEILTDHKPDRKKLASVVFNDEEALGFLNSLIHPLVRNDLKKWFGQNKSRPYVILEAAILFESGFYRDFDKIITVAAPKEICLKRLIDRDQISLEEIENRMKHQWDQEKKKAFSDFIIYNDDTELIIPQVIKIHNKLK
jgi:dephospho-CoA kinase